MWLHTKIRVLEKKTRTNKSKAPSDFKQHLKKLKAKVKDLNGPVKELKEKQKEVYYSARGLYRALKCSLVEGKSVASLLKAKAAPKPKKEPKEDAPKETETKE